MKTGSICVLMLLWTVPAIAQPNHLSTVQRIRATYPAVMSEAQKAELLNRVAWEHRSEGWGLLKKTGGSRCPAPQGVDVACDILVYAPTAWHFDVLVDGQIPAWQDDGPCDPAVSGCDNVTTPAATLRVHETTSCRAECPEPVKQGSLPSTADSVSLAPVCELWTA